MNSPSIGTSTRSRRPTPTRNVLDSNEHVPFLQINVYYFLLFLPNHLCFYANTHSEWMPLKKQTCYDNEWLNKDIMRWKKEYIYLRNIVRRLEFDAKKRKKEPQELLNVYALCCDISRLFMFKQ